MHDGSGVNCVVGCEGGGIYELVGVGVGVGVGATRGLEYGQSKPKHSDVVPGPS